MFAKESIESKLTSPPNKKWMNRFAEQTWTSHNIPLGPGLSTIENPDLPLIGDDPRTNIIRRLLHRTGHTTSPGRLLDLGALEGGLSLAMAESGFEVVCVEGRAENAAKCTLVRDYFNLSAVMEVLEADVRDLNPKDHGQFDVILCCGLLYHLDDPFAFLHQLYELLRPSGALFIDSHLAPSRDDEVNESTYRGTLSSLQALNPDQPSLQGRWIKEHDPKDDVTHAWTSIGNSGSFWATKESVFLTLEAAGFDLFFEVFGAFPLETEFQLRRHHSRAYLLATKPFA